MKKIIQKFLISSNDVSKDCYRWNLVSSLLFAFQSVIILMVLTRTVGIEKSGIFTIGYASASLFLFIGKYGVRHYQVSDVGNEHTFKDYQAARIISVAAMVITSVIYAIHGMAAKGYSVEKGFIILFVCLLKIPDAIEDVFYGEYQRRGRLDVGAKAMALRYVATIFGLLLMVVITRNLLFSLIIITCISCVLMWYFVYLTSSNFELKGNWSWRSVKGIFLNCFPLFIGSFLSQYIGNAPKYAIDAHLGDELQACYGFVSMPVFVIGLLSNVVFTPLIYVMAENWVNNKALFVKRIGKQILIIMGITLVCIVGAYFLGVPVLSIMYNTNLLPYKKELLILLVGGGFLALAGLMNTVLTIMRCQHLLFWGYASVALIALLGADKVVSKWGMQGATWFYTVLMATLSGVFIMLFILSLIRDKRSGGSE